MKNGGFRSNEAHFTTLNCLADLEFAPVGLALEDSELQKFYSSAPIKLLVSARYCFPPRLVLSPRPQALDVWSAGIILLCFLTRRFPFFNSNDDAEALMELAALFGHTRMSNCAFVHSKSSLCVSVRRYSRCPCQIGPLSVTCQSSRIWRTRPWPSLFAD